MDDIKKFADSLKIKWILYGLGLLLLAAFARLIPHPWNFSPLAAMAIFGGYIPVHRFLKYVLPMATIWLSDVLVNNILYKEYFQGFVWWYEGFYWQYGTYLLIILLSERFLNTINGSKIIVMSLISSLLFYLITNFGVWYEGSLYPKTLTGLISCYVAGLPFLKGTLAGDLIYNLLFLGMFFLLRKQFPAEASAT